MRHAAEKIIKVRKWHEGLWRPVAGSREISYICIPQSVADNPVYAAT